MYSTNTSLLAYLFTCAELRCVWLHCRVFGIAFHDHFRDCIIYNMYFSNSNHKTMLISSLPAFLLLLLLLLFHMVFLAFRWSVGEFVLLICLSLFLLYSSNVNDDLWNDKQENNDETTTFSSSSSRDYSSK